MTELWSDKDFKRLGRAMGPIIFRYTEYNSCIAELLFVVILASSVLSKEAYVP